MKLASLGISAMLAIAGTDIELSLLKDRDLRMPNINEVEMTLPDDFLECAIVHSEVRDDVHNLFGILLTMAEIPELVPPAWVCGDPCVSEEDISAQVHLLDEPSGEECFSELSALYSLRDECSGYVYCAMGYLGELDEPASVPDSI